MSNSSLISIVPATTSDLDVLSLIFSKALDGIGPFFPLGVTEEQTAWRRNQLDQSLKKIEEEKKSETRDVAPFKQCHLVKAVRSDTNEIVGFCLYNLVPEPQPETEEKEAEKKEGSVTMGLPKGTNEKEWKAFLKSMKDLTNKFVGARSYVSIDLLAVDSNHRGLGTGALLIKHCFNSVSSLLSSTSSSSLPFFLCATPLAVPLYKKLGFKSLNDPKENTELSEEEKRWAPTAMIVE